MRLPLIVLLFSLLRPLAGWAQPAVTLNQWPAPLQLYPRDQTSQCSIAIAGRGSDPTTKSISLVVLKNQKPYQYARTNTDSLTGRFAFTPIIRAELSEYSFYLFAHRVKKGQPAADSVQVAFRDSIVCGDVFLIMGQSNAVGRFDDMAYRNEFCRTFGVNRGDVAYNPADTAWCLTSTTEGNNSLWGVELQRLIKEQQGIPTAVINGAAGSTSISDHARRDSVQPANMTSLYGRLLYRAQKAGVASRAKALIWRQGEAEAANSPDVYIRTFPQLYGYWKQDYTGLKKVYHPQLNILTNDISRAGALRDFQRRSNVLFGDNEPIATVGLPGYEGVHYNAAGYFQFGLELYRLIARDFYASVDTSNIQSPNLQRLFYSTPRQDELTLEFEPGQAMQWPADTVMTNPTTGRRYTQSLSTFMYTDYPAGESGLVKSVRQQGNRLILSLTKPITAKHLTYLPSSYQDNELGFYAGPLIRNQRGMRALTFYQVPIAPPLPIPTDLRATPVDTSAIRLTWSSKADSLAQWSIERADTNGIFIPLVRVSGLVNAYDDRRKINQANSLRIGQLYTYRVRLLSREAESSYSPVATASLQVVLKVKEGPELELSTIDPTEHTGALVYPNPASDQVRVRLPLDWTGDSVALTLTNEAGTVVLSRNNTVSSGASSLTFSVATLPVGLYVLAMQYRTGGVRCRLIVSR
ncbi:sialate O-acetylesterase [Spirosoma areae]